VAHGQFRAPQLLFLPIMVFLLVGGAKEELDQRRGGAPVVLPLASASTREWNWDDYGIPNPNPLAYASTPRESPPPQLLLAFPLAQAES
jgi:hypothetical protein